MSEGGSGQIGGAGGRKGGKKNESVRQGKSIHDEGSRLL